MEWAYWCIVKVLQRIDGHRRVSEQSLSHNIDTTNSTSQNMKALYATFLGYETEHILL